MRRPYGLREVGQSDRVFRTRRRFDAHTDCHKRGRRISTRMHDNRRSTKVKSSIRRIHDGVYQKENNDTNADHEHQQGRPRDVPAPHVSEGSLGILSCQGFRAKKIRSAIGLATGPGVASQQTKLTVVITQPAKLPGWHHPENVRHNVQRLDSSVRPSVRLQCGGDSPAQF